MNRSGILRLKLLCGVVLMLVAVTAADAYVLKGEHIVQLMVSATNLPRRFLVRQQISIVDQANSRARRSVGGAGQGAVEWFDWPGRTRTAQRRRKTSRKTMCKKIPLVC